MKDFIKQQLIIFTITFVFCYTFFKVADYKHTKEETLTPTTQTRTVEVKANAPILSMDSDDLIITGYPENHREGEEMVLFTNKG